jgi:hypothetical protein
MKESGTPLTDARRDEATRRGRVIRKPVEGVTKGEIRAASRIATSRRTKADNEILAQHKERFNTRLHELATTKTVPEIASNAKWVMRRPNELEVNEEAYLLLHGALGNIADSRGEAFGGFTGVFAEPRVATQLASTMTTAARRFGREGRKIYELAQAINQAARQHKGVVLYTDAGALLEERHHQASYRAAEQGGDTGLEARHAHFDELYNSPVMRKARPRLIESYPDRPALLVEELAPKLADGLHEDYGVTQAEAEVWLERFYSSLAEKNGIESLSHFREIIDATEPTKRAVSRAAEQSGRGLSSVPRQQGQVGRGAAQGNRGNDRPEGQRAQLQSSAKGLDSFRLLPKEAAPTFYSQLGRTIKQKMPARASVAQVRALITNPQSGVKADEVKWTGFDDFLAGKESVTKQEALDFLAQNNVKVEEVVKGAPTGKKVTAAQRQAIIDAAVEVSEIGEGERADIAEGVDKAIAGDSEFLGTLEESGIDSELLSPIYESVSDNGGKASGVTKFSQYTLPGAKEGSYRELLLTLPVKEIPVSREYAVERADTGTPGPPFVAKRKTGGAIGFGSTEAEARAAAERYLDDFPTQKGETYRSGHYDEPNILAHIRFNERTDADGKRVMFIEEVQSDWHQAGRKHGYKGAFPQNVLDAAIKGGMSERQARADINHLLAGPLGTDARPTGEQWGRLIDATEASGIDLNEVFHDVKESGVPNAPFAKTWHELAMRRALRHAAENGYDKVAWATGEMQNARYDLSKQVDSIAWQQRRGAKEGVKTITISPKGASPLKFDVTPDGNVSASGFGGDAMQFHGKALDEVVGKDVAQKIVNGEGDAVDSGSDAWREATKPESVRKLGENVFGRKMASLMPLDVVDGGVLSTLKHNQVRRAVIARLPVNVVNDLAAVKLSPQELFSKPDVLVSRLPVDRLRSVTDGLLVAMRSTGADLRAKLSNLGEAGRETLLLPTLKASDLNSREVAGLLSPKRVFHGDGLARPEESAATRSIAEPLSGEMGRPLVEEPSPTELAKLLNAHDVIVPHEGTLKQRFVSPQSYELKGDGLSVGGSGMKGFYDRILPGYLSKYGRKWGARVGQTEFAVAVHEVKEGENELEVVDESGRVIATTDYDSDAYRIARENPGSTVRGKGVTKGVVYAAHSIDITPQMKKSVMEEGQPLFKRPILRKAPERADRRGERGSVTIPSINQLKSFAKKAPVELLNAPRALRSSVDAPIFRQGVIFTMTNPKGAVQEAYKMFGAYFSEKSFNETGRKIATDEDFRLSKQSGIRYSMEGLRRGENEKEEEYQSSWAEKLPHVKYSEQAYIAFLDLQRLHNFKRMVRPLRRKGWTFESHPSQYKAMATFVNAATGKGILGTALDKALPVLNTVFYSARYQASRAQLLNPLYSVRQPKGTRIRIAREMFQYWGTVAALLGIAKWLGADVEYEDPTSSDYGKVKVGNTRYDIGGGQLQWVTFFSRLAREIKRRAEGDEKADIMAVVGRFFRSKLAPVPGSAWNLAQGKNMVGEKVTVAGEVGQQFLPIFVMDMIDMAKQEGAAGVAKTLPFSLLGMGVQTYQKKVPEARATKRPSAPRSSAPRRIAQ